jgi:divalent metal cation (Fe/Co/Zn/Cd) transporter
MDTAVNNVPQEIYEQIKAEITNKESVVGIDALHTHILVLHRLMQIETKLDALNEKLELAKSPH